jgi:1,2-phenylacetyl-CoA epoxidase catalytic subunit
MSDVHPDFYELLETMADNKFVLGDKLVEIGVSGPELEATHSAIALAQSELGHARHLYNWSFELQGLDTEVSEQSGKAFQTILKIEDWISLIAAVYVLNQAVQVVIQELLDSKKPGIEKRASKLLNELREPIVFSEQWSNRLLNDKGRIPGKLLASLHDVEKDVTTWLNHIQKSTWLKENEYVRKDLLNQFQTNIELLSTEKIEVP